MRTVKRAKAKLGIVSHKSAMDGAWNWELPKSATEECHANGVAPFANNGTLHEPEVEVDI